MRELITSNSRLLLYLRWVFANALAEMLGLGTTFAIGYLVYAVLFANETGILAALGSFLLMVSTGSIEGMIVGLAQWGAMHRNFPSIPRRAWVGATLVGALIAWFLGSLPSTIMSLGEVSSQAAQASATAEPAAWLVLLLAALMGLVLGVILAWPQWRVLRRAVAKAGWWIPANSAAWFFGMPIIFWAMDTAFNSGSLLIGISIIAASLAVTGAVVGAVHGIVLVWLSTKKNIGRATD